MNFASVDWIMIAVIAICISVAVAVAATLYFYFGPRKISRAMRARFGPEYDRLVREMGSRRAAEARLRERARRVESYDIRPLRPEDRARYSRLWQNLQAQFVDNPEAAVSKADAILTDLMADRGYPMADFDRRAADVSVDYPVVTQNYRSAHSIALRHRDGKASTEDLRQAIIHYKALFSELVAEEESRPRLHAAE